MNRSNHPGFELVISIEEMVDKDRIVVDQVLHSEMVAGRPLNDQAVHGSVIQKPLFDQFDKQTKP